MGRFDNFLPPDDRRAALLLYGMVIAICFGGYDSGIMTVILADKQFIEYYHVDATRTGVIAVIPWATNGLSQLFVGGTLASWIGRLWTIRLSMWVVLEDLGTVTDVSKFVDDCWSVRLLAAIGVAELMASLSVLYRLFRIHMGFYCSVVS